MPTRLTPDPRPASPKFTLRLHRDRFPGRPAFDTAVSHSMLRRVAAGALPESLRLYQPENVMLFSSLDTRRPGYARAVELAEAAGFSSAIRLAGGHAAAFLEESMAFAWAIPDIDARNHIRPRFERLASIIVEALERLGLDARVGEIPGEYCPGEFSVNIAGRIKVMGVGQRVIRHGAHVGGVLTVGQSAELRESLVPVYEALELDFRPETAGGISEFEPGLSVDDVIESMCAVLHTHGASLDEARLDDVTLKAAQALISMHESTRGDRGRAQPEASSDGKTLLMTDQHAAQNPRARDVKDLD